MFPHVGDTVKRQARNRKEQVYQAMLIFHKVMKTFAAGLVKVHIWWLCRTYLCISLS